jgi:hypothetical protein
VRGFFNAPASSAAVRNFRLYNRIRPEAADTRQIDVGALARERDATVSGMRSGLDGRAASSTDQSGGTAGLALRAFDAIAVRPGARAGQQCASTRFAA